MHDPANADARRARAKKAGKMGGVGRANRNAAALLELKGGVEEVIERVGKGTLSPRAGGVMISGFNVIARVLEQHRDAVHEDETMEQLNDLLRWGIENGYDAAERRGRRVR